MTHNPRHRIIVVSAISGVLVFGAAGFAAAATGGKPKDLVPPSIAPAGVTDPTPANNTATDTTTVTHIAIQEALDGKTVDWLEKVSDEQYGGKVG